MYNILNILKSYYDNKLRQLFNCDGDTSMLFKNAHA